jgi:hypothetical protein
MNSALIDKIAQAVLYEGYILYPYRKGMKNHHRWTFGGVFPSGYTGGEPSTVATQCLLRGGAQTRVSVKLRFLQAVDRTVGLERNAPDDFGLVDEAQIAGRRYQSWQEAIERSVTMNDIALGEVLEKTRQIEFDFSAERTVERLPQDDAAPAAALIRVRQRSAGAIEVGVNRLSEDCYRLTARVRNNLTLEQVSASRDLALKQAFLSAHFILSVEHGQFLSLIDPPSGYSDAAGECRNTSLWPVLIGDAGECDALLAAPIILYDYPQIAPESPGDLFDGTEIDEILSLRIQTLTDEEKASAQALDPRAAQLLKRTDALARDQLMRMHGTMRPPNKVQAVHIGSAELRIGDHVRLCPQHRRADAFDIILRGKTATIVAIEQDYENRLHVAVTVDDDPGADIGAAGKIGHRFFFRPDELEPLAAAPEVATP